MRTTRILMTTLLASVIAACGGGGGGGSAAETTPAVVDPTPATPTPATVASIVPGGDMTWTTTGQTTISIDLKTPDGTPAAYAAVRVFSLSRSSPQDGSVLGQPVPDSLLDSAATDASGHLDLSLRLPGQLDEVLVVATQDDTRVSTAISVASANASAMLTLER
jgi:hypothetical protein